MKRVTVLLLLFCFMTPFIFAQTEEEIKADVSKEMEQLSQELKVTFENLNIELKDFDIDLSGLEQLKDIDWKNHLDNDEGIVYLESDEFKQEMKEVEKEVNKAMKEVRIEMAELEEIDWKSINKSIEEAMKQVEKELSNIKKEE